MRDEDGVLLFAGGHNYPGTYTNGVIRTDGGVAPADVLERASAFFRPLRRGYAVWVRDHADADLDEAVREAGLWARPPVEGIPALAVDAPLGDVPSAPGLSIHPADDDEGRREYLRVVAEGYDLGGIDDSLAAAIFCSVESLRAPEVLVLVGRAEGAPVSAALAHIVDGDASIQWTATVPGARGRGFGRALFAAACAGAFARGARIVTAQSSAAGTPLWTSLGFRPVTRYRRYLARPPAPTTRTRAPG